MQRVGLQTELGQALGGNFEWAVRFDTVFGNFEIWGGVQSEEENLLTEEENLLTCSWAGFLDRHAGLIRRSIRRGRS